MTAKQEKWKKRIPLLASFLIPLLIAMIVCIDHGIYPFGERCILHIDMYHQYCPFFTEFMDKIKSGESLMYSWSIGLGADFVSLYAYYLASPLNWLLFLCPRGAVIEFMTILVILKIALCGLTMGYYLKQHFNTNHFVMVLFATAYALCGFMAAYAWNIMWTDCMVLAPIIVLGLEKLVKEGKAGLYYGALAVSILSNYYISIMICIFLVLYFVILWIEKKGEKIKTAVRFGWYSLLAGGTAAVLLLPEIAILGISGSQNISFPDTVEWYFNLLAEMARHCALTESYTGRDHWPNVYSGVFVLLFFVLYLFNKEISWKKKVPRVLLLACFIVGFANNVLDFIWHGLDFPDALPGRQAFLYTFVLLVISCETLLHIKGNKPWHVGVAMAVDVIFLTICGVFYDRAAGAAEEAGMGLEPFIVTLVFIACYGVILILWQCLHGRKKEFMMYLGCLLVLVELLVNFDVNGLSTTNRTSYVKDLNDYQIVLSAIEEKEAAESETGAYFYRTEELERKTKNDAALSGYYSATQFSSLMNLNVSHIYQDLGMEGGKNFYCVNGATPLISSMLSLKYVIADNASEENPIRVLVAQSGNTYLYENKYSLPLGYMVSEEVCDTWDYDIGDEIVSQNQLAQLLGADTQMLNRIASTYETGTSTITVEEDGYIFATYGSITSDTLTEEISDGRTKSFTKASHGYILDLGYCHAGDVIKVTNTNEEEIPLNAYVLDLSALETAYQTLSSQTMTLEEFSDTYIRGTIEVKDAGRLIFSIAKEDGWTLYVDGKEVETEFFAEAFMSTHLEEGTHEIELRYETPGLRVGFMISMACVGAFVVTQVLLRSVKKRSRKKEELQ